MNSRIFHCIFNGITDFLYMEEALQIIYIGKKEVQQIVGIAPFSEEQCQLIRFLGFISYCPKMIVS